MYNVNYINSSYYQYLKSEVSLITLSEIKTYLKLDADDESENQLLQALIDATVLIAENFMNIDLLTTTYYNFRSDLFSDLTLKKGFFQSVDSIFYLKDDVYTLLDSTYYQVASYGIFGKIWDIEIPDYYDENPEAIKIIFKTGFGDNSYSIPENIILAIKTHIAYLYENRGDCLDSSSLPFTSELIYKNYKVVDL